MPESREFFWSKIEREIERAEAARPVAPAPVPLVIHFARFEEPFLRALHARHGSGPFPFELVCSHAVARRLLPELPRRTLRSLAGYFGAAVPPLRRSVDHVVATALVLGSEGSGVRQLVRRTCDRVARIPMKGKVGSLNASASAAIALYEAARQRRTGKPSQDLRDR